MNLLNRKTRTVAALVALGVLQAACGSSSSDPTPLPPPPPPPPPAMASFEISVSNLTNAQPLSPAAVILHQEAYSVFTVGTAASLGLEDLAEGGSNAALLAEADAAVGVTATASGAGAIGPGGNETITVDVLASGLPGLNVSVISMLVNTNDAFSGLNSLSVESMAVGETISTRGIAYDAGTEFNSETAATIPGPAGNGEGFNAVRDDRQDAVKMHQGVVSRDDGYAGSDLTEAHRFDNSVIAVSVTRTN
ncbi:MAG: spondin domain-containing protein [Pseudomonadota bacterium]